MSYTLVPLTQEYLAPAVDLFIESYKYEQEQSPLLPSRVIDEPTWIQGVLQSKLATPGVAVVERNQLLAYKDFFLSRRIRLKLNPPMPDQRSEEKGLDLPFCNVRFSGHNTRDMSAYLLNMKRRISMAGIFGKNISVRSSILQCATLIMLSKFRDA